MSPLYLALVHHPVRDRLGETVTTAVTNIDVHDLARTARTYDLAGYFVVTPITAQQAIVARILTHFTTGAGRARVPARAEALGRTRCVPSLEAAVEAITASRGAAPTLVVTSAAPPEGAQLVSFSDEARALRSRANPTLLVFGTGHGLVDEIVFGADRILAPIRPGVDYNHLSVRAAAAICVDRLIGDVQ